MSVRLFKRMHLSGFPAGKNFSIVVRSEMRMAAIERIGMHNHARTDWGCVDLAQNEANDHRYYLLEGMHKYACRTSCDCFGRLAPLAFLFCNRVVQQR